MYVQYVCMYYDSTYIHTCTYTQHTYIHTYIHSTYIHTYNVHTYSVILVLKYELFSHSYV